MDLSIFRLMATERQIHLKRFRKAVMVVVLVIPSIAETARMIEVMAG
jgi:hypothetical protein